MSTTSTYFGRIQVSEDDLEHNLNYLLNLPVTDETFHPFTREMFSGNSKHAGQEISIAFARTYKNFEFTEWLPPFEELIRNLKWTSISVMVETEFEGIKHFEWFKKRKDNEQLIRNGFVEKEEWFFGRGHQSYSEIYGINNDGNEIEESLVMQMFIDALSPFIESKANMKLISSENKDGLTLESSDGGLKTLIVRLLKIYKENFSKRQKEGHDIGFENIDQLQPEFDVSDMFHVDSPMKIKNVRLYHKQTNKNWIFRFVDKVRKMIKNNN